MEFFLSHLQSVGNGMKHKGKQPTNEDMTASLENLITYIWLKLIHPDLPALVKQEYGVQLKDQTLASIQPGIALSMRSLLSKLDHHTDLPVIRCAYHSTRRRSRSERRSSGLET